MARVDFVRDLSEGLRSECAAEESEDGSVSKGRSIHERMVLWAEEISAAKGRVTGDRRKARRRTAQLGFEPGTLLLG
jgi:hypothetical protein